MKFASSSRHFFVPLHHKVNIMGSKKILFIGQEITPYVPETVMSLNGRQIPQAIQESGCEIRTFLPKWGNINERRNQLHEVIRLSGMNIIINDTDHPLIIKVATLQAAHMQVYFIDNEDFFQKRLMVADKSGKEYTDNYERSIFYVRSVMETIKKLRWYPDIIHCQGWISATTPFYLKNVYCEETPFANTKVVYSLYDNPLSSLLPGNFKECLAFRNVTPESIDKQNLSLNSPTDFDKFAISFSDGVVVSSENIQSDVLEFARQRNIPIIDNCRENETSESVAQRFSDFYDSIY